MIQHLKIFFGIISIIAVMMLAGAVSGSVLGEYFNDLPSDMKAFWGYASTFGVTLLWAALGGKFLFGLEIPNLVPEIRRIHPTLIVGGVVLIVAMNIVLSPLQSMLPTTYIEHLESYMQGGLWAMAVAVLLAPVMEEFIFRGIIQRNIARGWGTISGIVFSSILFGVAHIIPQQIVAATSVGLILGAIYYLTRSLNTVIAIHMFNNGFSYLLYWIFGSVVTIEQSLLGEGALYWTVYGISLALILGSVATFLGVMHQRESKIATKHHNEPTPSEESENKTEI